MPHTFRASILITLVAGLAQIALTACLAPLSANAKEAASTPHGIFVVYPARRSVSQQALASPKVDGVLIRLRWNDVEPKEGQYQWDRLDEELRRVASARKKASVLLMAGIGTPDWVYAAGAQSFTLPPRRDDGERRFQPLRSKRPEGDSSYNPGGTFPIPWDTVFIEKWTRLISQFGSRYRDNPTITLVHMAGPGKVAEMALFGDRRRWIESGFTRERYINAWKRVIDAYNTAFPRSFMDVGIHTVLGDATIPEDIAKYASGQMGARFGLFAAWLSAREPHGEMIRLHDLIRQYSRTSFAGYQMVWSASEDTQDRMGGPLQTAIDTGLRDGARYFEIYEQDILRPEYRDLLENLHKNLTVGGADHDDAGPR